MNRCLLSILVLLFLTSHVYAAQQSAWIQYAAQGSLEVRLLSGETPCPTVSVDGHDVSTTERSGDFSIHVCAARLPDGASQVIVDGQVLATPPAHPNKIVVIGDSGCRIKSSLAQACNDPRAWPLPVIAQRAAAEHPDLVIHVGDYLYRESPCPVGDHGCAGSPWGDNWKTWNADFFQPAAPLLAAAPWLMMRGNHEECDRAGEGWTLFFSPDPKTTGCSQHDHPYHVDVGGLRLLVLDDNAADDVHTDPTVVAALRDDLLTEAGQDNPFWLLVHHPLRGVAKLRLPFGEDRLIGENATLLAASHDIPLPGLQMILSGHIHTFEVETFGNGLPAQLIAGVGGDLQDTAPADLTNISSGGWAVKSGLSLSEFGYVTLERQETGWSIAMHGTDGTVRRACQLMGRDITCQAP